MLRIALLFAVLLAIRWDSAQAAEPEEKIAAATAAAEKWLALVDAGKAAESWQEASSYFRGVITEEQWSQATKAVRAPLGKIGMRKVKSAALETKLPGAPDGEYVVIQFEASFENKKEAIETITPMLDKDGQWRVAGYFIK